MDPLKVWSKKVFFIIAALLALLAPDLLWAQAGHLLHIFFEALSFLLEEVLIHGLGFTKHGAQMLVFYTFLFLVCGAMWLLSRRLPLLLEVAKARLHLSFLNARDYVIQTWLLMSVFQKIKIVLANLVGLGLGLSVLLM
ncbi:MAG: hypothetical protein PHH11_05745 [Methylomonas sp.]|nr:hypothetical protein [Methylomonas sp.]